MSSEDFQTSQPAGWIMALGTGALYHLDPALVELAELAVTVAGASTQAAAREHLVALRTKARDMRRQMHPMAARALSRVVRRAERASGGVVDKRARLKEFQATWHELLACLAHRNPR
jgi:hypothetical protein